jgi:hypothetical protein
MSPSELLFHNYDCRHHCPHPPEPTHASYDSLDDPAAEPEPEPPLTDRRVLRGQKFELPA